MTKIETANSIIKSSGDIAQTNDVQAFVPNSTCLTKLSDSEISIIEPLLLQVDSDEADRFRQYLKEGKILRCRVFNEQGVYIAYKDESGYSLIFSFKEVMRDYTIATYLENEIKKLLSLKKADEKFTVIHDTKQLYLQQFLFKAKFKKPHCGLV